MNNELLDTIKKLSQLEGFKDVCHEQSNNNAMPSTDVLQEIVQLGTLYFYFGILWRWCNSQTRMYHIGVNVDRLQLLLSQQQLESASASE